MSRRAKKLTKRQLSKMSAKQLRAKVQYLDKQLAKHDTSYKGSKNYIKGYSKENLIKRYQYLDRVRNAGYNRNIVRDQIAKANFNSAMRSAIEGGSNGAEIFWNRARLLNAEQFTDFLDYVKDNNPTLYSSLSHFNYFYVADESILDNIFMEARKELTNRKKVTRG